jgi:hypothetical protein
MEAETVVTSSGGIACPKCGGANAPGGAFCVHCGGSMAGAAVPTGPVPPPAAPRTQESAGDTVAGLLRSIHNERTGAAAAAVVFVVAAIVSAVGWVPLSLIPRLISSLVSPGTCTSLVPGSTAMYFCSAKVALLTLAGPIIVMAVILLLGKQLTAWLKQLTPKLPPETHFLIAPVLATVLFTIPWAGVHYATSFQTGILPQTIFPAVIGLFTYAVGRFGPSLQGALSGFFDFRDQFPMAARIAVAVLVPLVISFLITYQERVSDTALKEQFVVLISLATGYLALAPRSGDFASSVGNMLPGQRGQA